APASLKRHQARAQDSVQLPFPERLRSGLIEAEMVGGPPSLLGRLFRSDSAPASLKLGCVPSKAYIIITFPERLRSGLIEAAMSLPAAICTAVFSGATPLRPH